ncbi:MAG: hypothetical protein RIR00_1105 [Pseudomonadota bacterium]
MLPGSHRAVLNENDIDVHPPAAYTAAMFRPANLPEGLAHPECPDPLARAPRLAAGGPQPRQQLHLAPPPLRGALVALISRDSRGCSLSSVQRLTHFPASPLVTLSWFHDGMPVGRVECRANGPQWQPFPSDFVLSGSQSRPLVSWAPQTGRGYMACFPADVARQLFGVELAAIHDRFVPLTGPGQAAWAPLRAALLAAPDDDATLTALATQLGPRWQTMQGNLSPLASLRQVGRHWVERLAWQAHEWRRSLGQRQVERRVREFSGRSLREWQGLTRTESLFFLARDRHAAGHTLDWAEMAAELDFADQAHLSRAARRVTGFAPGEFTRRFLEDESFWLYRLWV